MVVVVIIGTVILSVLKRLSCMTYKGKIMNDIDLKFLKNFGKENCLIIAEVAQAHDGSLGTAHAYIDAIAKTGADAVKFQTHIASEESTASEPWRVKFSKQDVTRYDYWQRMEFTPDQWAGLKEHADEKGLLFLSSPFSIKAFDLLYKLGVPAWKVASGETSNKQLLYEMLKSQLPIFLSTGMSPIKEIDDSVETIKKFGNPLAILQCTSMYPTPPEKLGLNMLQYFKERYDCPVGLSDHSGTIFAGLAAVTLGATALEVHVTLSRESFGPDVVASVTTKELSQLVEGVRFIEKAIYNPIDKEKMAQDLQPMRNLFMKSIVTKQFLPKGSVLTEELLTLKKPGNGLPERKLPELLGRRLKIDLAKDTLIKEEDLE